MIQVKVCGMREPQNIEELLQLPIEYIGFIFYPKSKRYVGDTALSSWIQNNAERFGFIQKIGVFVNESIHEILNYTHDYQLDYLQLHGDESPEYCAELSSLWRSSSVRQAKLIKAFSIDENFDFDHTKAYENYCSLFLFDTKGDGYGGTGKQFNWDLLEKYQGNTPFLLSGGIDELSIDTITAFDHDQYIGIDINSKFEIAPALKDINKIERFISKLKQY